MDREKVIKAYECVITRGKSVCECGKCDYYIKDSAVFFCDNQRVLTDVLSLLKEQEAMKPISKSRHGANPQIQHFCRRCNAMLFHHKQKYCIECGQAVKWNA